MGAAVRIMRAEHTAADLRGLAAKSRDGAQVRRLLALAIQLHTALGWHIWSRIPKSTPRYSVPEAHWAMCNCSARGC